MYRFVEGLLYYYTNEGISVSTGYRIAQPTNAADGEIAEYMAKPENWVQIPDAELKAINETRSPTIPCVPGTAAIVLSPNTIRNWAKFDDRAGVNNPGIQPPSAKDPKEQAVLDMEGYVSPDKVSTYRVNGLRVTFVPLSSEVDYSTLLGGEGGEGGADAKVQAGLKFKRMGQDLVAKALAEAQRIKKPNVTPLRTGVPQKANERNPTITTKKSVVYGSILDTFSSTGGGDGDADVPTIPISYFPSSYDGVYPEIISYMDNPNLIWKMTYTDYLGGSEVRIKTNIDTLTMDLGAPKPIAVARSLNEIDTVKGAYENRWVNVADETVSYGALTLTVPREFRNVVATQKVVKTTTEEGADAYAYEFTPKNIGVCLLTWDFEFNFL